MGLNGSEETEWGYDVIGNGNDPVIPDLFF